MDRAQVLQQIEATYEARISGDKEGVAAHLAPGANFRIAGDASLLSGFPAGPEAAQSAIGQLIDRVQFHSHERLDTVIEGNNAAVHWRTTLSVDGKPPVTTEMCDLWRFDDEGRATSLLQFIDTGLLRQLLTS